MSHRKSDLGIPCTQKICQSSASQAMAAIDHDYVADVLNRFRPETRRYMHSIVEPPITKRSSIRQSELLADALRAIDRDRAD